MIIYHMLPARVWQVQPPTTAYHADTLATEGFAHCTKEADRLLWVANRFYQSISGEFVILCLDTAQIQAELRWEAADGHLFPHVYGPINQEAVVDVLPFPRNPDGMFLPFI